MPRDRSGDPRWQQAERHLYRDMEDANAQDDLAFRTVMRFIAGGNIFGLAAVLAASRLGPVNGLMYVAAFCFMVGVTGVTTMVPLTALMVRDRAARATKLYRAFLRGEVGYRMTFRPLRVVSSGMIAQVHNEVVDVALGRGEAQPSVRWLLRGSIMAWVGLWTGFLCLFLEIVT